MKTFWNQPLPAPLLPDPVSRFRRKWEAIAKAIPSESEALTDEQKMAVSIAMHVPLEMKRTNENTLTISTRYPVGFAKVNGKWTMFQTET